MRLNAIEKNLTIPQLVRLVRTRGGTRYRAVAQAVAKRLDELRELAEAQLPRLKRPCDVDALTATRTRLLHDRALVGAALGERGVRLA